MSEQVPLIFLIIAWIVYAAGMWVIVRKTGWRGVIFWIVWISWITYALAWIGWLIMIFVPWPRNAPQKRR